MPTQPKRFSSGGFSQIQAYVEKLMRWKTEHDYVIISTTDGNHAISVRSARGGIELSLHVNDSKNSAEVTRTREFFKARGLTPRAEYPPPGVEIEHASRRIEYLLVGDAKSVSESCVSVFAELFGVDDKNGLEFQVIEDS